MDVIVSDVTGLKKKIPVMFLGALAVVGLMLFLPAGTLDYWQAWVYMGILFIPMLFVLTYFLKKDPKVLERRIKLREKESRQNALVGPVLANSARYVYGLHPTK